MKKLILVIALGVFAGTYMVSAASLLNNNKVTTISKDNPPQDKAKKTDAKTTTDKKECCKDKSKCSADKKCSKDKPAAEVKK